MLVQVRCKHSPERRTVTRSVCRPVVQIIGRERLEQVGREARGTKVVLIVERMYR